MRHLTIGLLTLAACAPMHANSAELARCPTWRVQVHNNSSRPVDVVDKTVVIGSVGAGAEAAFVVPAQTSLSMRLVPDPAATGASNRTLTGVSPSERAPDPQQIHTQYECDKPQ